MHSCRIYPWSIDAIRLLRRAGFAIVVVTNQGGIARGLYSSEFVEETHRALAARLPRAVRPWTPGITVRIIPRRYRGVLGPCACRKPEPGMVHDAAASSTSI